MLQKQVFATSLFIPNGQPIAIRITSYCKRTTYQTMSGFDGTWGWDSTKAPTVMWKVAADACIRARDLSIQESSDPVNPDPPFTVRVFDISPTIQVENGDWLSRWTFHLSPSEQRQEVDFPSDKAKSHTIGGEFTMTAGGESRIALCAANFLSDWEETPLKMGNDTMSIYLGDPSKDVLLSDIAPADSALLLVSSPPKAHDQILRTLEIRFHKEQETIIPEHLREQTSVNAHLKLLHVKEQPGTIASDIESVVSDDGALSEPLAHSDQGESKLIKILRMLQRK